MEINETIVTGRKLRKLIDGATKQWQRISLWHKASDCEFDDGKTAEEKLGAIDGITDSLDNTSSRIAASAKSVAMLNNDLGIATRQNPEDPTKAQWRPRGSEGEWVNFTKPRRIIEQSFTNSSIPKSVTVDGVVYDYIGCKRVVFAMSLNNSYTTAEAYLEDDGTFRYGHGTYGQNNTTYGIAIYIERM